MGEKPLNPWEWLAAQQRTTPEPCATLPHTTTLVDAVVALVTSNPGITKYRINPPGYTALQVKGALRWAVKYGRIVCLPGRHKEPGRYYPPQRPTYGREPGKGVRNAP